MFCAASSQGSFASRVWPLIWPVVVISFPSHLHLFLLALPRIILCGRLGSFLHLPGCIIGQLCRFFRAPPGLALRGWRQDCRRSAPPMCSLAGLYLPGLCIPFCWRLCGVILPNFRRLLFCLRSVVLRSLHGVILRRGLRSVVLCILARVFLGRFANVLQLIGLGYLLVWSHGSRLAPWVRIRQDEPRMRTVVRVYRRRKRRLHVKSEARIFPGPRQARNMDRWP